MSLLINPIAVMLVANGHGLTAVKIPNIKAVIAGIELLSNSD
jgi:hypothetical protein